MTSHTRIATPFNRESTADEVPERDPALPQPAGGRQGNPLSERELAILRLVADGLPNKRIGWELALAERTVKAHVTGAMNKLGAFSRAQALAIAVQRNYL